MRAEPIRNTFRYRSYQWFVDLDALPRLPLLLRPVRPVRVPRPLGDPARSLRENIDAYLAENGIDLARRPASGMLTNARVLGYVFNPLTRLLVPRPPDGLACAASIAEVHNTYGQRHRYLLQHRRARPRRNRQAVLRLAVLRGRRPLLDEPAGARRAAAHFRSPCIRRRERRSSPSMNGRRRPAARIGRLARTLLRPALVTTVAVSARIRWQGIKLYVRGLPVVPRRSSSPAKEHG